MSLANESPAVAIGPSERRGGIVAEVQRRGWVSVSELSRVHGVSQVAIRNDLRFLADAGLVQRARGGARALPAERQTADFDVRLLQNAAVKREIGKLAATLIRPGDCVFLDAGTTVLEVARGIPRQLLQGGSLTVVTRSLTIASELRAYRQTRLVILGGVYVHDFDGCVGEQLEASLARIRVGTLFLGTDGLSLERGISTDYILEAGLLVPMRSCAERAVVVTDSSKIGRDQFQAVLPLDRIDTLVTDSGAAEPFVEALRRRGIEVLIAPRPDGDRAGKD